MHIFKCMPTTSWYLKYQINLAGFFIILFWSIWKPRSRSVESVLQLANSNKQPLSLVKDRTVFWSGSHSKMQFWDLWLNGREVSLFLLYKISGSPLCFSKMWWVVYPMSSSRAGATKASGWKSRIKMLQCGLSAITFLEQSADSGLLVPTVLEKHSFGLRSQTQHSTVLCHSALGHWAEDLGYLNHQTESSYSMGHSHALKCDSTVV